MGEHLKNIENISKISEDTFSITYKGRSLFLTLNKQDDILYPKLYEELKIRNLSLSDVKRHKSFNDCDSIDHVEEKLKQYLIQGKVEIVENQSKYHLVLFNNISDIKEGIQPQIAQNKDDFCIIPAFKDNIINNIDKTYKRLETEFNSSMDKLQKGLLQSKTHIKKLLNKEELFKECSDEVDKLISVSYKRRRIDDVGNKENNLKELKNQKIKDKLNAMKWINSINTPSNIKSMLILPNSAIALGMEDYAHIWEPTDAGLKAVAKINCKNICSLSILPDGNLIFMRLYCSSLFIWDLMQNKENILDLFEGKIVKCYLVLKSGKLAVAVDCRIYIIDKINNVYQTINTFDAHRRPITAMANFLEDQFVSSCAEILNIWDSNYKIVTSIDVSEVIVSLLTLPNKYIVAKSRDKITIFNLNKDFNESTFQKKGVAAIALLQNYYLILGCLNGDLEVWDIQEDTNECLYTLNENGKAVNTILVSEQWLFVAYHNKTLKIWKIEL
jgi:WD40 repeat protein